MRRPGLIVLLCVLACGEPRFDPPEPQAIEPAHVDAGASVEVVIRGRHFLPRVEANYGERERSRVDGAFGVRLAEVALEDVAFVSTTELRGRVPAGLAPGRYALVVVGPSGAEGHLADAFEVMAGPAVRLAVVTPERTVRAGECSLPVELEAQDADGFAARLDAPVDVPLAVSPEEAVSLFSDPECDEPLTSVRLDASASRKAVYFSGTAPGTATLTARFSLGGVEGGVEQKAHVVPGPAAAWVWGEIPSPQRVGVAFTVRAEARDAFGNFTTEGPTNPELDALPETPLSCRDGCKSAGKTDFQNGVFEGEVAVEAVAPELRLTLRKGQRTSLSNAFAVMASPKATALAFTSPDRTVGQGACSEEVVLELRGASNEVLSASAPTPVSLTSEPDGVLFFFSDAACQSPLTQASFAAGESQLTFYFSGQLPGAPNLTATSPGLVPAVQQHLVTEGSVASFAFDAIPSPQRRGADIPVRVRALDGTGAVATSFTGSAVLSLSSMGGHLSCSSHCTNNTVTQAFQNGVWTGTVRVGGPVGSGRMRMAAASGRARGNSADFSLVDSTGTPPRARLVRQPAVVRVGQPVTLDASSSTDLEGNGGLQVSFDVEGHASAPPPWSDWRPITTPLSRTFAEPGLYRSRIAVRDVDGDVGYATADVLVLDRTTPLCVVTDGTSTDHDISSCDDPNLSLTEALRIANGTQGRQVITFRPGLQVAFTQTLTVSGDVDIIAPPGVTITGPRWSFSSGAVLLSSLSLQGGGNSGALAEVRGGRVRFSDVTARGSGSLALRGGQTTLEGSRFESCAATCVVVDDGAADVRVRHSSFHAPGQNGLDIQDCEGGVRELVASTFRELNVGFHVGSRCGTGPVVAVNNTFDQVGSAARYDSGRGHVLVNNIITRASSGPIRGCNASFAQRGHNLLWSSALDDCTAADPGVLWVDPMFIASDSGDYRLRPASPARDSALDTGVDVTPGAPGKFLGLAPDLGGRETW